MMSNLLTDPFVQTGILALIGALLTRVVLRNYPTFRLIGQVLFFTGLTVLLAFHGILPYAPGPAAPSLQSVFIGLAKIIWWINAAWSLISIVRVFLIFERTPREGRLLQDLVVGLIYVSALLSIIAYVFNAPVGTLIATSGVFAVILGLAMQSTLSDLFSGLALNIGSAYGIGDWLILSNGIEGKVVETNWRATHLLNGSNDLVVVPNADLAKARLVNLSSPERSHGVTISISFRPTTEPSIMTETMRAVFLSSDLILRVPEPSVMITALDAAAVSLELSFYVSDYTKSGAAKNEIFDLIYRHALATGLILSMPPTRNAIMSAGKLESAGGEKRNMQLRLLDAVPLFASLTDEEKEVLAADMRSHTFRKGEVLAQQDEILNAFIILRSGVAAVTRSDALQVTELGRLAPGSYFGEAGLLTGAGEPGTVRALTFVVAYEISKESLGHLLKERPTIADELAMLLARRMANVRHAKERSERNTNFDAAPSLSARIRQLFTAHLDE